MSDGDFGDIELAAAIGQVRAQLAQAIEEGADSPVAFRAGPIQLDFDVTFTKTGGGEAGVRVWVVTVSGKGEVASAKTHRLSVTLTPVDRSGRDKLIGSVGDR